jgi:hypothetical protein
VTDNLAIEADWERLESGPPEERAAFGAIGVRYRDVWLTEAEDTFVGRVRQKVPLSGYRLAEWMAWNWWRLRWEPRRRSADWALVHKMGTIGGGYVWPNVTIVSDGERVLLNAEPTNARAAEPIRYLGQFAAVARAAEFESAVDTFIERVKERVVTAKTVGSNLELVWQELLQERGDPEVSRRRKVQAMLGLDADEESDVVVERLIRDSEDLGENAIEELAAETKSGTAPLSSKDIEKIAQALGSHANPKDMVVLEAKRRRALPQDVTAWKRGVAAAVELREQEKLGAAPVSNHRLCELAGVVAGTLTGGQKKTAALSFKLDSGETRGAIVLRSRYETGRRFGLARLIGDSLTATSKGRLLPATSTYTYRQKLQRAFAGEFLCPFDTLINKLSGDYSDEAIEEAAEYFNVSTLTVRTLLMNHNVIEKGGFFEEYEYAA